jgi:hypothetical protein
VIVDEIRREKRNATSKHELCVLCKLQNQIACPIFVHGSLGHLILEKTF